MLYLLQKYFIILFIVSIIKVCKCTSIWIQIAFKLSFSGSLLMVETYTISFL